MIYLKNLPPKEKTIFELWDENQSDEAMRIADTTDKFPLLPTARRPEIKDVLIENNHRLSVLEERVRQLGMEFKIAELARNNVKFVGLL